MGREGIVGKIDPNAVYVCMESHMSGRHAAVTNEGDELLGSDERVQAAPHLFTEAGTPRSQWRTPFDTVGATIDANSTAVTEERKAAFDRAAKANTLTIAPPKLVKAKRDVVGELDGQPATVKKGSQLPADHPFVLEHQEAFAA